MYWDDHAPPHFHARYEGNEVVIDIRTLKVLRGKISRRALALVLEWALKHRDELMEDWELCQRTLAPKRYRRFGSASHKNREGALGRDSGRGA